MTDPVRKAKHCAGNTSPLGLFRETGEPSPMIRPAGPTLRVWTAVLILGLFFPACSHWRESYLKDAIRKVSQDEVIDRFGEPWKKKISILNGQTTWIYRYALTEDELDPMGVNALSQGWSRAAETLGALIGGGGNGDQKNKPKCFHYVLTFDKDQILKHWEREACAITTPL